MKKIILFISCVFCFGFANGQAPTFEWAKSMGGTSAQVVGNSVAADSYGNACTTGFFNGTVDFDPGVGAFNLTALSGSNIFISKLEALGNFVWVKQIGDSAISGEGISIAIDAAGNIYTTGHFAGTGDFDPGPGIFNLSASSGYDIFILKLDALGNFVWAKNIGGASDERVSSIALDALGNVYTTGCFFGTTDFDPGSGTFNLTSAGGYDIFISKLDSSGNFILAKNMGGTISVFGNSIVIDATGNIYTTGEFNGTADFDPNVGVVNITSAGSYDIFVSKLDALGNFVWAKNIGGTSYERTRSITLDVFGNIYTTGYFEGTVDFDPNAGTANLTTASGYDNMFISKLDVSGNYLWAKSFGGTPGIADGYSIAIDSLGNVYSTGVFYYTVDFDPGVGIFNITAVIDSTSFTQPPDIFISKLDALGDFVWAKSMGGSSGGAGMSIVLDGSNNIYTTGGYSGSVDFDPNAGVVNFTSVGVNDIFVLKLSQQPTSINETTNPNSISIYPNPNNGTFNISFPSQIKNASIEVYNSLGALVSKKEIINQENTIELLNQANGLYFVKVMSEDKIVGTRKIIKE